MPSSNERIGAIIQQGITIFSRFVPFTASTLVSAIAAAVLTKILDQHEKRVSEVLSIELSASHVPYLNPDDTELLAFYEKNFLFPELRAQFEAELSSEDLPRLRQLYPYLYAALILKRQLPQVLFHREIEQKKFRDLALAYEELSRGYTAIEADGEFESNVNHFAGELLVVLDAAYEEFRKANKNPKHETIYDIIDLVREIAKPKQ
jgi:hypothetical protein